MFNRAQAGDRRIDIDLLRAVAVLAVMLFHFDVAPLGGGFLGVDIFFVISGYLITQHIRQQVADGSFSFANFYARRIRRLFPALAATLLLTSIAALLLLPQSLLHEYVQSVAASSAYLSNVYFWSIADYFDSDSIHKPLLHTWSLSVEEQFYLFWPLVVLLFARRHLAAAIVILGLASLLAGLFLQFSATSVFYHFPFRVHEFAAGALATCFSLHRLPRRAGLVLIALAVAAIGSALLTTTGHSAFPGWGSGAVIAGTALIIATPHPLLNTDRAVFRPFLRIGLISYSAYLIHWPMVVFYKILRPGDLGTRETLLLLAVTLVLAELSYRFVEQPAARVKLPRFRFAVIAMAPVMLIGAAVFHQTYPGLRSAMLAALPASADPDAVRTLLDGMPGREATLAEARRLIGERATGIPAPGRKTVAILGDSHAEDFFLTLRLVAGDDQVNAVLLHSICDPLTLGSIPVPLEELYRSHAQDQTREKGYCQPVHESLVADIVRTAPDVVVFSEAWRAETLPYLPQTLAEIRAAVPARILVLGRVPQFLGPPDVIFRNVRNIEAINQLAWARHYTAYDDFDSILSGIARKAQASFVSKTELVCPRQVCDVRIGADLGYTDTSHWSVAGMQLYGRRLLADPVFREVMSP